MSRRYLIDSNHMGAALLPVSHVRERIVQQHRAGFRFATIVPVLCELEVALCRHSQQENRRRALAELLKTVRVWPLESSAAGPYAAVREDLRRQGRVASQIDMLLAAVALATGAVLLTTDRDFEALPDIRTENWVTS